MIDRQPERNEYDKLVAALDDRVTNWLKFSTYVLGQSKGVIVIAKKDVETPSNEPEELLKYAYRILQENNIWERRIKGNPHIELKKTNQHVIYEKVGFLKRKKERVIPASTEIQYRQPNHPEDLQETATTLTFREGQLPNYIQETFIFTDNTRTPDSFVNIKNLTIRDATFEDLQFFDSLLVDPNS